MDQFLILRADIIVPLQKLPIDHHRGQIIVKLMGNMAAHLANGLHSLITLDLLLLAPQQLHTLIDLL